MRFLHTADLHLGKKPDQGYPWADFRADAVQSSLGRLIKVCRDESLEMLLIAGDLFHEPPLTAELKEVNSLFASVPHTKVVLIAGNHDFVRPGSAYARFTFSPNVCFLSGDRPQYVSFPQWNLAVHGISYSARELKTPVYDDWIPPKDGKKHILLAHGGDAAHAPIRTAALKENGWDYVALGHLHKPANFAEKRIAYPGSPEPLDYTETGSHGYYIGTIHKNEFSLEWRPFSLTEYTRLTIHVDPATTESNLNQLISERAGTDYHEILDIILEGRRDPELHFDTEALCRLGSIRRVTDNTVPDYPWDDFRNRPPQDLLARFVSELGREDASFTEQKALYFGLDALLHTEKSGVTGVIK